MITNKKCFSFLVQFEIACRCWNQIKPNQFICARSCEEWLPNLLSRRLMYQTCEHSESNLNLEMLVFRRGEKPLVAEKRTNNKLDPHDNTEFGNRTPGHTGRRRVLSPLHHPCYLFDFGKGPNCTSSFRLLRKRTRANELYLALEKIILIFLCRKRWVIVAYLCLFIIRVPNVVF